jgi:hypothetical protein
LVFIQSAFRIPQSAFEYASFFMDATNWYDVHHYLFGNVWLQDLTPSTIFDLKIKSEGEEVD